MTATSELETVYQEFCGSKSAMDGKSFVKCAKDSKLIGKLVTSPDLDIIFNKVKDKGARTINFDTFVVALEEIAAKSQSDSQAIFDKVAACSGPVLTGTKADKVRHYDDKSMFTGVHGKGGPSTVDFRGGLPDLLDRSDADARGVKKASAKKESAGDPQSRRVQVEKAGKSPKQKARLVDDASSDNSVDVSPSPFSSDNSVDGIFQKFTAGKPDMDGKTFAKFAKDCNLIDGKKLTTTDVDLIFAKAKGGSSVRKLRLATFELALDLMAEKRGQSKDDLVNLLNSSDGPVYTGTKAGKVSLYDDKSTFTGVHGKGGPSTVDRKEGLQDLLDRSEADARGVKKI